MFPSLKNKNILITGGAQGLGLAMTERFLELGSHVHVLDILEPSEDFPTCANFYACDITKSDQIQKACDQIQKIDVLINNAGILRDASLFKMTAQDFDKVIDVHLKGTFMTTQRFAQVMKAQKSGAIINISSVAAFGNFGQTNYSAAKAGIIGMTKTWALELSKHNIRVNAIAPGLIKTAMTRSIPEDVKTAMIDRIPLKRMGEPKEIAHLAAFLASDDASYIQGQVININGGFYI